MNFKTEQEIEAILSRLGDKASIRFESQLRRIVLSHGPHPVFATDAMAREAARVAQANVLKLLADAQAEVSAVSPTVDAFRLLKRSMVGHLANLAALTEQWNGAPLNAGIAAVVDERFAAVRQDLIVHVDACLHHFKNQGGRPSEWDWEAAKAHIKARHPNGFEKYHGLQAQVAEAMTDWFEAHFGCAPGRTQTLNNARDLIDEHQR